MLMIYFAITLVPRPCGALTMTWFCVIDKKGLKRFLTYVDLGGSITLEGPTFISTMFRLTTVTKRTYSKLGLHIFQIGGRVEDRDVI